MCSSKFSRSGFPSKTASPHVDFRILRQPPQSRFLHSVIILSSSCHSYWKITAFQVTKWPTASAPPLMQSGTTCHGKPRLLGTGSLGNPAAMSSASPPSHETWSPRSRAVRPHQPRTVGQLASRPILPPDSPAQHGHFRVVAFVGSRPAAHFDLEPRHYRILTMRSCTRAHPPTVPACAHPFIDETRVKGNVVGGTAATLCRRPGTSRRPKGRKCDRALTGPDHTRRCAARRPLPGK